MRIWTGRLKLLVASLLTFITNQPSLLRSYPSYILYLLRPVQLVFAYDVEEAVLQAMERGKMHVWTNVETKAICMKHGLGVRGAKAELMERVKVHFQRLYGV